METPSDYPRLSHTAPILLPEVTSPPLSAEPTQARPPTHTRPLSLYILLSLSLLIHVSMDMGLFSAFNCPWLPAPEDWVSTIQNAKR